MTDAEATVAQMIRTAIIDNWPVTHDNIKKVSEDVIAIGKQSGVAWAFKEVFGE